MGASPKEHLLRPSVPYPDGHAVYRCSDATGRLIYIGYSSNVGGRLAEHLQKSPWWPEVEYVDISWYGNRRQGLEAEREMIWREEPPYNLQVCTALRVFCVSHRKSLGGVASRSSGSRSPRMPDLLGAAPTGEDAVELIRTAGHS